MKTMTEMEEWLTDILSEEMPNFTIETLEDGQVVIFTGLAEDVEGELIDFDDLDTPLTDDLDDEEEKTDDEA